MLDIILFKLGLMKKYDIEYNSLITTDKNQTIDFYYWVKCPEHILRYKALKWLKGKIQTCSSNIVYIEKIGDHKYSKQFIY